MKAVLVPILAALLVAASPVAFAQNPDYVLSLTDVVGNPGSEVDVDVLLDNMGDPVDGYSYGICHDSTELTVMAGTIGPDAQAVNGGDGPDFFATEILPDGITNIVVISFFANDAIGPGVNDLYAVTYTVDAPAGTVAVVEFCDTLGTPTVDIVLAVGTDSETPVVQPGSVESSGMAVPPEFAYDLPTVNGSFDPDTGVGSVLVSPTIEQTVGAAAQTTGFSMGVAHDPGILEAVSVESFGPLLALNGGTGPDTLIVELLPNGVTVVVEYSTAGTETIVFNTALEPIRIGYDTNAGALQGVMTTVSTDLEWSIGLGTPPVQNEIVFGSPPMTVVPTTADGAVNLFPAGMPFNDYLLSIPDATTQPGGQVDMLFNFDSTAAPILGWSWGACHDTLVDISSVAQGTTTMVINGGGPPDFFQVDIYPGEGWTVGCVIDFFGISNLPPGLSYNLAVATYDVLGPDGSTSQIDYCGTLGNPPVGVIVVDETGTSQVPDTVGGTIEITTAPPQSNLITRGDCDGDGFFNGLVDGIFILTWQFVPGSDAPPCFDAADADDDGTVNGLVDGIVVLNFQFLMGSPPPPDPGPFGCGEDPTMDTLDCAMHPCN